MKHLLSGTAIAAALVRLRYCRWPPTLFRSDQVWVRSVPHEASSWLLAPAVTPISTQVQLAKLAITMGRDIRWPTMGVRATARPTS